MRWIFFLLFFGYSNACSSTHTLYLCMFLFLFTLSCGISLVRFLFTFNLTLNFTNQDVVANWDTELANPTHRTKDERYISKWREGRKVSTLNAAYDNTQCTQTHTSARTPETHTENQPGVKQPMSCWYMSVRVDVLGPLRWVCVLILRWCVCASVCCGTHSKTEACSTECVLSGLCASVYEYGARSCCVLVWVCECVWWW